MSNPETEGNKSGEQLDRWGAVASTACALHCAACAFVPAMFAVLGLDILLGHEAEWGLTLLAVGIGVAALGIGWRRHKNMTVLAVISIGIVGLLVARSLEGGHHDEHAEDKTHAAASEHAGEKKETQHKDEHREDDGHHGEGHHEDGHLSGELIGIIGGLLLMFGHVLNLREIKRINRSGQTNCAADC